MTDDLTIHGGEAASQFVAQDFENVCVLDNTLQFVGSGTAAECNNIFNGD